MYLVWNEIQILARNPVTVHSLLRWRVASSEGAVERVLGNQNIINQDRNWHDRITLCARHCREEMLKFLFTVCHLSILLEHICDWEHLI